MLDFSNSYTVVELEKNGFKMLHRTNIINPYQTPYYLSLHYENAEKFGTDLSDALIHQLKIKGCNQRRCFRKNLREYLLENSEWDIQSFVKFLEEKVEKLQEQQEWTDGGKRNVEEVDKIVQILEPCAGLGSFHLKQSERDNRNKRKKLTIIQLSDFPKSHRKFMAELLSTLTWKEAFNRKGTTEGTEKPSWDLVAMDEFQFMSLEDESALSNILRQGRKFGMSLLLSTQFIEEYSSEEVQTLLQANNKLIFKPTEKGLRAAAKIISETETAQWRELLSGLKVGEAVLKGSYFVGEGTCSQTKPFVCIIE